MKFVKDDKGRCFDHNSLKKLINVELNQLIFDKKSKVFGKDASGSLNHMYLSLKSVSLKYRQHKKKS